VVEAILEVRACESYGGRAVIDRWDGRAGGPGLRRKDGLWLLRWLLLLKLLWESLHCRCWHRAGDSRMQGEVRVRGHAAISGDGASFGRKLRRADGQRSDDRAASVSS
jgi:hypothetical protein